MNAQQTYFTGPALALALSFPTALHADDAACAVAAQSAETVAHALAGSWTLRVVAGTITSGNLARRVPAERVPPAPVSIAAVGDGLLITLDANGIPVDIPLDRAEGDWKFDAEDPEVLDAGDLTALLGCDANTLFRLQGETRVVAGTTADFSVFLYVAGPNTLTGVLRVVSPQYALNENVTLSR